MADRISPSRRSLNMSRIRARDTGPELAVRRRLHAAGFRFRLDVRDLPGRPDIVLPRYRTVVFVHGCFWHRHPGCPYAAQPKTRQEFWEQKFVSNVERDRRAQRELREVGWCVEVVWECQASSDERVGQVVEMLRLAKGNLAGIDGGGAADRDRRG